MAWSTLLGLVSMEQFGQFHNVLAEAASQREAFFIEALRRTSAATTRTPAPHP
jgi:hypothetical protein